MTRAGTGAAEAQIGPGALRPMLAVAGRLPEGPQWRYELKWDGVRALAYVDPGGVRLLSRSGRDLSATYAELCAADLLAGHSATIDGEIVALLPDGRPSFQLLQSHGRARRSGAAIGSLAYFAFDLLALDGQAFTSESYERRREELERLRFGHPRWVVPGTFGPPGADVVDASRARGLEGVVAKRRTSRYLPGRRSDAWVKVKNFRTQEVVIGGWSEGEGRRAASFGSLLLGIPRADGRLEYVGNVGTGFDDDALRDVLARLRALELDRSPFAGTVGPFRGRRTRFVSPELVGEVRFSEWTDDGRLRQSSWRGLRLDKNATEVAREA
jgi:bifunctional non-homologous end joining protein LigD